MRCWRSCLFLCLTSLLYTGEARVVTEAQTGPLYRVVGAPLSISCNVSGMGAADSRKEFDYRVNKPDNPTFELKIISTASLSFSYNMFRARVKREEITLKHASPNSVVFGIQSLKKEDEGEYDCTAINSLEKYDGIYNFKTTVKVIDNTLSVSSPVSGALSRNEGDALALTCQAFSNTIQHTHLSVAWYLRTAGEEEEEEEEGRLIISLDRDFTLSPGPGFEARYRAGLVRLDKVGEATFGLQMAQLELSDQGEIYCRAQEWIQDPDRSWYSIAQKNGERTSVNVKAREVAPDTSSLLVTISTPQASLQEGQELSLSCHVDARDLPARFLSVAWLRGDDELARIGPTGVLAVGPAYAGRERGGELRAARVADRDYRLVLRPVRAEDQGEYFCRAWPQDRGQDGAFTDGAAQTSSRQLVGISATESGLSVEMQHNASIDEGERLKLTCKVDGFEGRLSVTWQRQTNPTAPFSDVAGLSQEGVVDVESEFWGRGVRATRPSAQNFSLELDQVTAADAGVYRCSVTESTDKTHSQSQTCAVTVNPAESYLSVKLIGRNNVPTVGERVELMCRVKRPRVPLTVTWTLQRDASVDKILTLYSNGDVSWSGDPRGYQLKVVNKEKEVAYYLTISRVTQTETGIYQCLASVSLEKVPKKLPPSNPVAVMVQNPASKLTLISPRALLSNISRDVNIKCSVISEPFATSRYAIAWLHQQGAENTTIVSSDQDALVTFGARVEPGHRERLSVRRTKGPSFELTIRQVQISDNGSYVCEVTEWLQDRHGNWYQLSPVSTVTELNLVEPEKNLSIEENDAELNVSRTQDFTIPCSIRQRSSGESRFKVTWFWQKPTEAEPRPIFIAYRNATLQDRFGQRDRLMFRHPATNRFGLTVLRAEPENGGVYFCEVEEWLPSPSGGWRRMAVETSENTTVNVDSLGSDFIEGAAQCSSGTWIWILVALVICAVLVISLLVVKIHRRDKGKKSGESFWAEAHPLNGKSNTQN